jgi:PAS domain S-box-containing protein
MMNETDKINQQMQQELRKTAEKQHKPTEMTELLTVSDSQLRHELRTHQIELEMQNEELRCAQLALEHSRDCYVDLYEFAPVSYLSLNIDGIITQANLTASSLLGIERTKLIRGRFSNYIADHDKDRWYRYFLFAKQQQLELDKKMLELSLCRADGSFLYTHICLSLKEKNILLTITDITARKQAEDALQVKETRLALALDIAELASWDWNINTGQCIFDDRWTEMCGFRTDEVDLYIHYWQKAILDNDLPKVQQALNEHLNGDTPFFTAEYRIRHKSGTLHWILDRGKVVERDKAGKPLRMTGVAMDITQRKQMEQRLRVAAAAFESQSGIVVTDANKDIISTNQAFTRIMGYSANEAIGHTPFFLSSGLYDESFYQSIWSSLAEQGYWQAEVLDKRKNGEIFPILLSITAVTDDDGFIGNYVGSFIDLTTQKQAEKILLDAQQSLENQVATTQQELKTIQEESIRINTALNVLLNYRETDKSNAQNALSADVETTVFPFLQKLKAASRDKTQSRLLAILEKNLQQLVSNYGRDNSLSSIYQKLTPSEIQVASMVRQGLSTKLIASTLNISTGTVSIHRKHIRKKLALNQQDDNLFSYLASLSE